MYFLDPPILKSSNDTTVNEGAEAVSLVCEILVDGYPRNYSDLYWQHWIGNQLIRELASDTNPIIPTSKKYTLTLKSVSSSHNIGVKCILFSSILTSLNSFVKQNFNDTGHYVCLIGNGISNLDGKVEQTAQVELVVQGNVISSH